MSLIEKVVTNSIPLPWEFHEGTSEGVVTSLYKRLIEEKTSILDVINTSPRTRNSNPHSVELDQNSFQEHLQWIASFLLWWIAYEGRIAAIESYHCEQGTNLNLLIEKELFDVAVVPSIYPSFSCRHSGGRIFLQWNTSSSLVSSDLILRCLLIHLFIESLKQIREISLCENVYPSFSDKLLKRNGHKSRIFAFGTNLCKDYVDICITAVREGENLERHLDRIRHLRSQRALRPLFDETLLQDINQSRNSDIKGELFTFFRAAVKYDFFPYFRNTHYRNAYDSHNSITMYHKITSTLAVLGFCFGAGTYLYTQLNSN